MLGIIFKSILIFIIFFLIVFTNIILFFSTFSLNSLGYLFQISVLREVIHDLESQIEAKTAAEQELRKHLASLQSAFDQESRCHNDLADQVSVLADLSVTCDDRAHSTQMDSLRTDQSTVDLTDHIAVLEEQILAYTRQLEHLQNSSPAVRDMKSQVRIDSCCGNRPKQ